MDRARKRELVASLNQTFGGVEVVVVTHYTGMTVAEMTDLRARMRAVGASFKVTKNKLTRLALQGTEYEAMADLFTGPTAIGYSSDPVSAPKVIAEFAKKNDKLVIVGGMMGTTLLDTAGVQTLATMPSLDELRAKLIAMIQTPATRIAGVVQAPAGQLARVFGAYAASEAA